MLVSPRLAMKTVEIAMPRMLCVARGVRSARGHHCLAAPSSILSALRHSNRRCPIRSHLAPRQIDEFFRDSHASIDDERFKVRADNGNRPRYWTSQLSRSFCGNIGCLIAGFVADLPSSAIMWENDLRTGPIEK